jgi:TorA maturation chaperone TorD
MQESALGLLGLYEEAGFELEEEFEEQPDHVALELEFLGLLTSRVNEARRAGATEALAAWELLRVPFLRGHLGAWIGRFATAVRAGARTAFYRELANCTARFVRLELEALPPA